MHVLLRPGAIADAKALTRVRVDAWRAAYAGQIPDDYLASMTPLRDERRWLRWLQRTDTAGVQRETWVATTDAGIVGFTTHVVLRDPVAMGELLEIYVDPRVERRGVGRALLANVVQRMTTAGCTTLAVRALETNTRAHRFYEASGWRRVPRFRRETGLGGGHVVVVVQFQLDVSGGD